MSQGQLAEHTNYCRYQQWGRKVKNSKQKAVSQKLKYHTSALTRKGTVDQFLKKGQNLRYGLCFSQRIRKGRIISERKRNWSGL